MSTSPVAQVPASFSHVPFEPKQIHDRPPNFDRIVKVFPHAAEPGVIFAYFPAIYVPSGMPLPDELVVHECVHLAQQQDRGGPESWWDRYMEDPGFRLQQEVEAHRAEYHALKAKYKDRNIRNRVLHKVALKLAAPLYGYQLTYADAKRLVQA
jgi:hypothetical protein